LGGGDIDGMGVLGFWEGSRLGWVFGEGVTFLHSIAFILVVG
jgi:hypothetical protein